MPGRMLATWVVATCCTRYWYWVQQGIERGRKVATAGVAERGCEWGIMRRWGREVNSYVVRHDDVGNESCPFFMTVARATARSAGKRRSSAPAPLLPRSFPPPRRFCPPPASPSLPSPTTPDASRDPRRQGTVGAVTAWRTAIKTRARRSPLRHGAPPAPPAHPFARMSSPRHITPMVGSDIPLPPSRGCHLRWCTCPVKAEEGDGRRFRRWSAARPPCWVAATAADWQWM